MSITHFILVGWTTVGGNHIPTISLRHWSRFFAFWTYNKHHCDRGVIVWVIVKGGEKMHKIAGVIVCMFVIKQYSPGTEWAWCSISSSLSLPGSSAMWSAMWTTDFTTAYPTNIWSCGDREVIVWVIVWVFMKGEEKRHKIAGGSVSKVYSDKNNSSTVIWALALAKD